MRVQDYIKNFIKSELEYIFILTDIEFSELSYRDASGNYIYDPEECDRDYGSLSYPTFCGYYIIRY